MSLASVHARIYKNHRFDNWESAVAGRWSIEDLRADTGYCHDWISFDCLAFDRRTRRLYVGLTAIDTDILHVYDPTSGTFESLGFTTISDRFDAKLHRSLEIDDDGRLYMATALLHDMNQQMCAAGGKLVCYDPVRGQFDVLAIPVPHQYIQSILLDRRRRCIYGFTFPAEFMFRYELNSGEFRTLAYVGNGQMICQPHTAVLDRAGRVWGTWGETRAFEDLPGPVPIRLFSYDPDSGEFNWFNHGLPKVSESDVAQVDHMMLANDGRMYVGTTTGGFSCLDPRSGAIEDLGKPFEGPRLAGLAQAADGLIYGAGNAGYASDGTGQARLFRFDPNTRHLDDFGPIYDETVADGAAKVHTLVAGDDGVLFAGENDNVLRSAYLWECRINGAS